MVQFASQLLCIQHMYSLNSSQTTCVLCTSEQHQPLIPGQNKKIALAINTLKKGPALVHAWWCRGTQNNQQNSPKYLNLISIGHQNLMRFGCLSSKGTNYDVTLHMNFKKLVISLHFISCALLCAIKCLQCTSVDSVS